MLQSMMSLVVRDKFSFRYIYFQYIPIEFGNMLFSFSSSAARFLRRRMSYFLCDASTTNYALPEPAPLSECRMSENVFFAANLRRKF